jgi:hypothetical protein
MFRRISGFWRKQANFANYGLIFKKLISTRQESNKKHRATRKTASKYYPA